MKQLESESDIKVLVDTFYEKVKDNELIGFIFEDVAKIDWNIHLPRMYDFWGNIAFGLGKYKGNPMQKHIEMSYITTMSHDQFDAWLQVWMETIDELFVGEKAEELKSSATNIAALMLYKITQHQSFQS